MLALFMILNPRTTLWTLRHTKHKPKGRLSDDLRYMEGDCPCGRRALYRVRGAMFIVGPELAKLMVEENKVRPKRRSSFTNYDTRKDNS